MLGEEPNNQVFEGVVAGREPCGKGTRLRPRMECALRSQTYDPGGMCSTMTVKLIVMACPKRRSSIVYRRLPVACEVCLTPRARWVATAPKVWMRCRRLVLQYGGLDTRRMTIARMAPVSGRCALGIDRRKREKKGPHMFLCPANVGSVKRTGES
ncbi:hypothetical protein P171DRAFT_137504 [Karstenula rhodostoma CBS 690.94]|uniref:Uncharacterized protein n=1 Tax=Karstenula rhodostoma CBS 690.94 TaxID=1392251 RepID=A0A9P4PTS3_9PLEO|nr:hypothetical protein P171DRAFT_137504 [Karstenula rhodostoma CBS 690.94]